MSIKLAIVAGETSGDYLGAQLIEKLRQHWPDLQVEGIGGPRMVAQGCRTLYPMEKLSVMGITEVFGRLVELLVIRHNLLVRWRKSQPDLFVGIDAPAFNLRLEYGLKKAGIKAVHYVSPTIWAWRAKRVHKIAKSVNLMLTLFPFEKEIYQMNQVPVEFVGHPLADEIPLVTDAQPARQALGIAEDKPVLAVLPGSRSTEIRYLGEDFIKAAAMLAQKVPGLQVVVALVSEKHKDQINAWVTKQVPSLHVIYCIGAAQKAMASADVVLTASGTATLETMLVKRPLVAAYRVSPMTFRLAKRLLTTPFITMPNVLAGEAMIPEFVQDDIKPEKLCAALYELLNDSERTEQLKARFTQIHKLLKCDASSMAANALVDLVGAPA